MPEADRRRSRGASRSRSRPTHPTAHKRSTSRADLRGVGTSGRAPRCRPSRRRTPRTDVRTLRRRVPSLQRFRAGLGGFGAPERCIRPSFHGVVEHQRSTRPRPRSPAASRTRSIPRTAPSDRWLLPSRWSWPVAPLRRPGVARCSPSPRTRCSFPPRVSGVETDASARGSWSAMLEVDDPSTHQVSSLPSWRTKTVVTGPFAFRRTGTSPERLSPARNSPTTGSTKPTKSTENPRAAATGS